MAINSINKLNADFHKILELKLKVFIIKKGEHFAAYCPVLNLSAEGDNAENAKNSFEIILNSFITETIQRDRMEKELLKLGWQLQHKPIPIYRQPAYESIKFNISKYNIQSEFTKTINIPVTV
jgi:dTDP-4-amino-4,6-dideoxygalactose transaminase